MPIDYRKYPVNWKTEIRPAILERAEYKCEECSVGNKLWGYRDRNGHFYSSQIIEDMLDNCGRDLFDDVLSNCFDKLGNPTKPIQIVLTIAHLDHNAMNNDPSNLRALCQRCHLKKDQALHQKNSRETRDKKKGLQNLF